jgi:hypothetical protein
VLQDERGSATPLLALLVIAVGGLCLGLGRLGAVADAKAAAQTAADAAALAAAVDGAGAARAYASANGAELVSVDVGDGWAQVEVRLGRVHAAARGEADQPLGLLGALGAGGVGSATGLVPELAAALAEAARLLGQPVPVTSGFRSREQQQRLHDSRGTNPYPVARPGTSSHERGRAVDVPRSFAERLAVVGPRAGLCRPWPETDPVHFELCRRTP